MFDLTALARTVDRAKVQWHQLAHVLNVVSCGLMIGSAMFDPISTAESHRYCQIILPTFAISLLVWLALNLRAFMSVGRFSIPLGLVILLLVAIQGECTIKSFVAWLPLYAATVGLVTTSVYHVMTKQVLWATGPASFRWDDGAAGDAGVPWPECASTATAATGQQPQETQQQMMMPAVVARWMREPLPPWAGRCVSLGQQQQQGSPHRLVSPFSEERRRGSSSSGATTLSLSNITGRVRASWGSRVRAFFQDQDHDLDLGLPLAVPVPRYSGDGRDHHPFDVDDDRPTEF